MDKKCAACGKIVYPLEQLKCLDQVWHKTCFKCTVCGMTLNMKNYKGFEKKPYCSPHYPQPKAYTVVCDNPEMQRVKTNTAVLSNIKYHEEFEKAKGSKISVTDDPLTHQQMQNTQIISNAAYTQSAKGKGPAQQPTHGSAVNSAIQERRPSGSLPVGASSQSSTQIRRPGSIFDYDPEKKDASPERFDPARRGSSTIQIIPTPTEPARSSVTKQEEDEAPRAESPPRSPDPIVPPSPLPVTTSDEGPTNSSYGGQSTVYTSSMGRRNQDYEPSGGHRGSQMSDGHSSPRQQVHESPRQSYEPPRQSYQQPAPAAVPSNAAPKKDRGKIYRALYDYSAADDDEVSFNEGDVITNGDPIDEGWMYGIVERTGQYGMLPSNYVDAV